MFQLIRFNPDSDGSVDVIVEYDGADGSVSKNQQRIVDKDVATLFVLNCIKKYLLTKLRRFIDHKKVLSQVSNAWSIPETDQDKKHSLSVCEWNLNHLSEYPLDMICTTIVTMQDHLRNILPLRHQESYFSSANNIDDILKTCADFLSAQKRKAA